MKVKVIPKNNTTQQKSYDPNIENVYPDSKTYVISSVQDMDEFSYRFNHYNNYTDNNDFLSEADPKDGKTVLRIGDKLKLGDTGEWYVAGFDVEHNQTAADGTVYDNGYGIALIPVEGADVEFWDLDGTTPGGYAKSHAHTKILPRLASDLYDILGGDHLVKRTVLLNNSERPYELSGVWTTAYATLLSIKQVRGDIDSGKTGTTIYDIGEANYKLPLFDHINYKTNSDYWLRGIINGFGPYASIITANGAYAFMEPMYKPIDFRPMIYIR